MPFSWRHSMTLCVVSEYGPKTQRKSKKEIPHDVICWSELRLNGYMYACRYSLRHCY